MNPVAMSQLAKARQQDLHRAAEARRRAGTGRAGQRGLVTALLEKIGGLRGRREQFPTLSPEKRHGVSAT